jgi:isocitrate dehydrogenase
VGTEKGAHITHTDVASLLMKLSERNIDYSATELLFTYDGKPGYAVSQEEQ